MIRGDHQMTMQEPTHPAQAGQPQGAHPHGAHPHGAHPHGAHSQGSHPHMHGRNELPWKPEVWQRLDAAVHEELTRTRVAAKFLPIVHVPAKTLTVPSDTVTSPTGTPVPAPLSVDEAQTTPI